MHFCRQPHPTRACGAPPPPPPWGGVRAWRYLVGSRIRLFPTYPLALDRGDIAIGDGGSRGGGTRSPSPVSNTPETPHISPTPPRLPTHTPPAGTPHRARACGAPPPPPPGAEAVRGDIRRATVSGVEPDGQPCQVLRRQFC